MGILKPNVKTKDVLVALRNCTGTLARIVVEFSGSGDDGDINDIRYEGLTDSQVFATLPISEEIEALLAAQPGHHAIITLDDFVRSWADNLIISAADWDWVNNDGGGGTLEIEPYTGRVVLNGYYNETVETPVGEQDMSIENDPDFTPMTAEERAEVELVREQVAANG